MVTGATIAHFAIQDGWKFPKSYAEIDAVIRLNGKHAMVMRGSKSMVVTTVLNSENGSLYYAYGRADDIKPYYENDTVAVPSPTKSNPDATKLVPVDVLWSYARNWVMTN